jgi:ankyrin repeat protein
VGLLYLYLYHFLGCFISVGCNINTPRNHGYTPLHLAAKAGNADLIQWLLAHGADPDRVTNCDMKAVDFARKYGMAFK